MLLNLAAVSHTIKIMPAHDHAHDSLHSSVQAYSYCVESQYNKVRGALLLEASYSTYFRQLSPLPVRVSLDVNVSLQNLTNMSITQNVHTGKNRYMGGICRNLLEIYHI